MKKFLKLFFLCSLIVSCKSWDAARIGVKKDPISPKLLTLDKRIEDIENVTFTYNEDGRKLYTKEVEENLVDPYGEKYGYIAISQNIIKSKMGMGWALLNCWTLFTPSLFGCPILRYKYVIEVELRILDSKNKLLGKYSAIGKGANSASMYFGYTIGKAERKSYIDALNDAFNQIRPQIQKDATVINEKLKSAGKL